MAKVEDRKILIDVFEPNDIEEDLKKEGFLVERFPLKAGDYCLGQFIIERKDINDYYASMCEHRLMDQMYKLLESDKPRKMLVIIGKYPWIYLKQKEKKVTMPQLMKEMAHIKNVIFWSYGILVVHVTTQEDFINYIKELWVRLNTPTYPPSLPKHDNPADIKREMISALPRIGGATATYLAKNYTLRQLMDMSAEDMSNIKINGRKLGVVSNKIREVLDS